MENSTGNSIVEWRTVFQSCFAGRLRPNTTVDAIKELNRRTPISGVTLAKLVFCSGAQSQDTIDPLIAPYLSNLLGVPLLDTADILKALLETSQIGAKAINNVDTTGPTVPSITLENVLILLSNLYGADDVDRPKTRAESLKTYRALVSWLKACNTYKTMLQLDSGGLQPLDTVVMAIFEALGTFIVLVMNNITVKTHLSKRALFKVEREDFSSALTQFASSMLQWSQTQLPTKLQVIARNSQLAASTGDGLVEFAAPEISNAITDLPTSVSKAGMYIYLNAALGQKGSFDDLAIINHLHARYSSDPQAMIIELIIGSFDALGNVLHRHEPSHNVLCHRSFIANKLPLLLQSVSSALYPPLTAEHCIQMAFARIQIHPFPPLAPDSHGINDTLRECKQDFVHSCLVHQIMSESAVSTALQQQSSTKPPRTPRYSKDTLFAQCSSNVHKLEDLIRELDRTNGNAGTISVLVVEVLQHFCNSKETMSLKTLCNALSRRIHLIDIILQYVQLGHLLTPLCNTLNMWTTDEDQSELQPAYEEFAAILLLALALIHRYDVSPTDLPGSSSETFIPKLLTNMYESQPIDRLTKEQNDQLTKWIKGLYATDDKGETSGISDETMSGCPPQAFYLLVPTLFDQSVAACKTSRLNMNTLKGGLEFLLEPFLLPSVVEGFEWIAKHSWEDHKDAQILLQILQMLIRPSSISGDAQSMHKTILVTVAKPLLQSLTELEQRLTEANNIGELRDLLQPYADAQTSSRSSIKELKAWSEPSGTLRQAIANLVTQLSTWSSQSEMMPIPTNYTHRHIIAAIDLLGADEVLMAIVGEIRDQTTRGLGPNALEIGAALICAPYAIDTNTLSSLDVNRIGETGNQLSLRQALKLRLDDTRSLLDMETGQVETLVRLGRLVDRQSAVSEMPAITMPTNIGTDELMEGIDMSGTDIAAAQASMDQAAKMDNKSTAEFSATMDQAIDMGNPDDVDMSMANDPNAMNIDLGDNLFGDQDIDFSLDTGSQMQQQQQQHQQNAAQGNSVGGVQPSEVEDIFGEIDFGGMGDDDFDF